MVFRLEGVEILHKVRAVDGESVVVSGIGSDDQTVVDSSMFIGRQSVVFPRIGKPFLWLEKDGMWVGIGIAVVMVVIGCVPWKDERGKKV